MQIQQITDHVDRALSRVLSQYDRPRIRSVVAAVASQAQQLEDAVFGLLGAFDLASATGAQLDVVAGQLGIARYGLSDEQLRVLLYGIIALNNGNGTSQTMVSVAQALFQTDQVFFADAQSGKNAAQVGRSAICLCIGTTALPDDALRLAETLMRQAVGAGIELTFMGSFVSGNAFACAGPQAWVRGYASLSTPTLGGRFARLLSSNGS